MAELNARSLGGSRWRPSRCVRCSAAVLLLGALACLSLSVARARIEEYDRWQIHGVGLYLVDRGASCYLQIRNAGGAIIGEQVCYHVWRPENFPEAWIL